MTSLVAVSDMATSNTSLLAVTLCLEVLVKQFWKIEDLSNAPITTEDYIFVENFQGHVSGTNLVGMYLHYLLNGIST